MAFQLPQDVTAQRMPISPTSFEYTFRHKELGELGKVLICATHKGGCHITHQLHGPADDASFPVRRAIFEPLAHAVAAHLHSSTVSDSV